MLLKSLPVSLMLTRRRRRRSLGGSKRSRPKYPSRSLAAETCCLSLFSEWTLTLMTSHIKKKRSQWELLTGLQRKLGGGLDRDQWDWLGSERETWCHFGEAWCHFVWFDWTACLPFCLFVGLAVFIGVRVCHRMFAVAFAFIFEDCVLPVSVCHPTPPAKMHFLKIVHLCFNPPPPSSHLLLFLSPASSPTSSRSTEGSDCQKLPFIIHKVGETNAPQTVETLYTSFQP